MAAFNQTASAWSEARSNALTRDLQHHRAPFRITARAVWSCASIVVLAAAAAVGLGVRERSSQVASQVNAQIAAAQPEQRLQQPQVTPSPEFASDDAMLRQIDSAINTAEPSPEELYGIEDTSSAPRQNSRRTQVKD
jgi:hypothetical protein